MVTTMMSLNPSLMSESMMIKITPIIVVVVEVVIVVPALSLKLET